MTSAYPLATIRASFPALRTGSALFDGPGGTQTPAVVADAIRDAMLTSVSQRGRNNYSEQAADRIVVEARRAMGDFLNVDPDAVVFGRSATQIAFDIGIALAKDLTADDEIAISRLDHDANVRPWVNAAELSGATVRWIDFDPVTGDLTVDHVREAVSDKTKLVAITAASNLFGTRPNIPAISEIVHSVGALLYVDVVAYAAHHLVDYEALGADFVMCSPYKFCGPHIGVLGARTEVLEPLRPNKVKPGTMKIPERFELGTLPYEALAGVRATVEFIANLVPSEGTRRERLAHSYKVLDEYESQLFDHLVEGLTAIPRVVRISSPASAVPTMLFRIDGVPVAEVCRLLGEVDVAAMGGTFYSKEAEDHAQLGEGGVRVGLAPYSSVEDVDRLITAVKDIASSL